MVGLGDSVTAGYGASPGFSYFDRLVRAPKGESADMAGRTLSAVYPDLTVRSMARSGSTSIQHLDQVAELAPYPDDVMGVVVMTTGGNDLIHSYGRRPPKEGAMFGATYDQARPWVARFEERLETMVQGIWAAFPGGCHVFLATIYDPTDGTGDPGFSGLPDWPDVLRILSAYNVAIRDCAARHPFVHVVDMRGPFLGHGLHCTKPWTPHYQPADPHYWYGDNLEDPNDRGYDAVRRVFLLEMIKVLAGAGE